MKHEILIWSWSDPLKAIKHRFVVAHPLMALDLEWSWSLSIVSKEMNEWTTVHLIVSKIYDAGEIPKNQRLDPKMEGRVNVLQVRVLKIAIFEGIRISNKRCKLWGHQGCLLRPKVTGFSGSPIRRKKEESSQDIISGMHAYIHYIFTYFIQISYIFQYVNIYIYCIYNSIYR